MMRLEFDFESLDGCLSSVSENSQSHLQVLRPRFALVFPSESPSHPASASLPSLISASLASLSCVLPFLCSFLGHVFCVIFQSLVQSYATRCPLCLNSSYYICFSKVLSVLFMFKILRLVVFYSMKLFSSF